MATASLFPRPRPGSGEGNHIVGQRAGRTVEGPAGLGRPGDEKCDRADAGRTVVAEDHAALRVGLTLHALVEPVVVQEMTPDPNAGQRAAGFVHDSDPGPSVVLSLVTEF